MAGSQAWQDFFDLEKTLEIARNRPTDRGPQTTIEPEPWDTKREAPPMVDKSRVGKKEYVKYYRKLQDEEFLRYQDPNYTGPEALEATMRTGMSTMEGNSIVDGMSSIQGPPDQLKISKTILDKFRIREPQEVGGIAELPILSDKNDILDMIESNTVSIITGATGCGKTTMIPQFILNFNKEKRREVNIIVTQPRRIAAQSVARRVADAMGVKLGSLVGYKVGLDKEHFSPDTLLLYCTTGVLKKMLIGKRCLTDWTHVILDEVHDREEDMDFLMLLAKKFVNTNSRGVKLILMSATLDINKLVDYFSYKLSGPRQIVIPAAHHHVQVQSRFSVNEFFLENIKDSAAAEVKNEPEDPRVSDEMIRVCFNLIANFHSTDIGQSPGAVLVFLPGEAEIARVKNYLEKNSRGIRKWWILPLHSRIPVEDTQTIFGNKLGMRKIILSTNIAESSVTIPDIQYVIDFCLTKNLMCDMATNYVSLKLQWADKNSCIQRRGRCGRTCDGRSYRLVTSSFYDEYLPDAHPPEMLRAPLDKVILDTKLLDFGPPKEILALAMDPPDLDNISSTVMHLKEIGALLPCVNNRNVEDDGDMTLLGEIVASLPIDVRLGKLVVYGYLFGVLDEAVIIAAGLSNKPIFSSPFDQKIKAYAHKLVWADGSFSDCLAVLNAYKIWKAKKESRFFLRQTGRGRDDLERNWCLTRFLQKKSLDDMDKTIEEIRRGLVNQRILKHELPNRQDEAKPSPESVHFFLQVAIFGAFYPHYIIRRRTSPIDMREVHKMLDLRPFKSCFYLSGFPSEQKAYGELYADQIRSIFKDFCDVSRDDIKVSFVSSRVVVGFEMKNLETGKPVDDVDNIGSRNLTGEILHHVYIALKLRSLPRNISREKLTIQVYSEGVANEILQNLRQKEAEKRLKSLNRADASLIGAVQPPLNKESPLRLEVVYIANPNSIWVNYCDMISQVEAVADAIMAIVTPGNIEKWQTPQTWDDIKVGRVYLAPYDDCHFRARVDRRGISDENSVYVFFIDFGNFETVPISSLIIINENMFEQFPVLVDTPGLAMECSLAQVVPNTKRSGSSDEWDQMSTDAFKTLFTCGGSCDVVYARISTVIKQARGPLVVVDMYDDRSLRKNVTDAYFRLKDERGQVFAEKDYRRDFDLTLLSSSSAFPVSEVALTQTHILDKEEETRSVTLKGPNHPLEFQLQCLHRMGSTKNIKIEQDSVNSIFLDRFPLSITDQWIVAGRVDLNPSGADLLARQTTYMPNLQGLGPILLMIFAPRVELRTDRKKRRYTGCLTGLGSREKGWTLPPQSSSVGQVPYFPEHDTECEFDVMYDAQDIEAINKLRYYISRMLTRPTKTRDRDGHLLPLAIRREAPPEFTVRDKFLSKQRMIRHYFEKLAHRDRELKDIELFDHQYHWNEIPAEEDDLFTFKVSCEQDLILPTFPGIKLYRDKLYEFDCIIKALEELRDLATDQKDLEKDHFCPICDVSLGNLDAVTVHLKSAKHALMKHKLKAKMENFERESSTAKKRWN